MRACNTGKRPYSVGERIFEKRPGSKIQYKKRLIDGYNEQWLDRINFPGAA